MEKTDILDENGKVKWGELKQHIEKAGIADHDEIDRIDIAWGNISEIKIIRDEDYGWQVIM